MGVFKKFFSSSVKEVKHSLQDLPKVAGSLGYDPWGYSQEMLEQVMPLLSFLGNKYFRVKNIGLENIPKEGRALIISNHAGQLPLDGVMIGNSMITNDLSPRIPRVMIERFFPTIPWIGNLLTNFGGVVGDPVNCIKMLERDEAVIVFPEGVGGSGKAWDKRYQLQRFGSGFMHLAMKTKSPIIPVGVVGSEETMPSLGNFKALAKLLGIPYFPLGVLFPLPAQMTIRFGEPLYFEGDTDDESKVIENVEIVKDKIRALIADGLDSREKIF